MMLAAKKYGQKDLAAKILGPPLNPGQIVSGVQDKLQSGELDASASYKIAVDRSHLPFITLPEGINLSRDDVRAAHPDVNLTLGGKTFYPEPLVFYAALLSNPANAAGAEAFLKWLRGPAAQELFRANQFAAVGDAPELHR